MQPVKLFPDIYSITDFLKYRNWNTNLHPMTIEYEKYWEERDKLIYEGVWGLDHNGVDGGYRFCPPSLHFYITYCIIEIQSEDNTSDTSPPDLRDLDWLIHYDYLAARGCSGWKDAPFTCNRIVGKKESGLQLSKKEEKLLVGYKYIYDEHGKLKPYVPILDALYKTYESPLGPPVYENEAKDYMLFGVRGGGKTFSVCGIVTHEWVTHGIKEYNINRKPTKIEIMIGGPDNDKVFGMLSKIKAMFNHLLEEVGSFSEIDGVNETFYPGYFHQEYTGNVSSINSKVVAQYDMKRGNKWITKGVGSILSNTIYTTENPEKAASKRINIGVIEECGLVSNILDVIAAMKNSTIRVTKFGTILILGTSGNMDKVAGSQKLFEQAAAYNILSFKDVFEGRPVDIARFLPAYYQDDTFRDDLGNTDIQSAFEVLMEERDRISKSGNHQALEKEMMNRPIVPSEMFLTKSGNKLPVALLRKRHIDLKVEGLAEKIQSVGMLHYVNKDRNSVRWVNDTSLIPIKTYNIDEYKGNLKGGIVIYEHPPDNLPEASFFQNLYKVVYDPVKDDKQGTSLGSIIVYKGNSNVLWESGLRDTIVAEWIGRLDKVNDMHEIALKLCCYYNAKLLPEVNLPWILNYAEMTNRIHMIQYSPDIIISKAISNPSKKFSRGIDMTSPKLHEMAIQLLSQWLLKERLINNDGSVETINIDYLYTQRGLEEMIAHGAPGNYDYLSCLKILMLWLAQEQDEIIEATTNTSTNDELAAYFRKKRQSLTYDYYYKF